MTPKPYVRPVPLVRVQSKEGVYSVVRSDGAVLAEWPVTRENYDRAKSFASRYEMPGGAR